MKDIEIKPIKERPQDYDEIEAHISEFFRKEIYLPLIEILGQKKNILHNSIDELLDAIKSGRITFYRGSFKGRFNSLLSKELRRLGAVWDRRQGLFKIPYASLTPEIRNAIAISEGRLNQTLKKIDQKLASILPDQLADKMSLDKIFDKTLWHMEKKVQDSIKGITVGPDLTDSARARIAKEYSDNLKLYIKNFTEEETKKLREKIQKKIFAGNRYEDLIGTIQRSYQVSRNKAKFLARQETSILMANFKEARYRDVGSQKYKWKNVVGSPKHPVRPMHKKLDNTIQLWSSPPIVNEKGDRKNPGCDYGCRCYSIPIISFRQA